MQFLKLLSEHFGAIKPGEYDVDVRLAVSESGNMVVFLWRRVHTALYDMVVVCDGENYCHSQTWWYFVVEKAICFL